MRPANACFRKKNIDSKITAFWGGPIPKKRRATLPDFAKGSQCLAPEAASAVMRPANNSRLPPRPLERAGVEAWLGGRRETCGEKGEESWSCPFCSVCVCVCVFFSRGEGCVFGCVWMLGVLKIRLFVSFQAAVSPFVVHCNSVAGMHPSHLPETPPGSRSPVLFPGKLLVAAFITCTCR